MKPISIILIVILFALPLFSEHCGSCGANPAAQTGGQTQQVTKKVMSENKIVWLNNDYYAKYTWEKKPKIGTVLLFVDVYNKNKQLTKDISIQANAYMPSMRGAHDTGFKAMKLNKKNRHVIDVNFMMRGAWELELKFVKGNKAIYNALVQTKL